MDDEVILPGAHCHSSNQASSRGNSLPAPLTPATCPALPNRPANLDPPSSFTVVVPTRNFATLGLRLDSTEPRAPTVLGIEAGAVREFNKVYKASEIRPFDVLMALDGVESWTAIQKKLTSKFPEKMFLTLRRPRKTQIVVEKTDEMGMTLAYSDQSVGVVVKHLDCHGLMMKWNTQNVNDSLEVLDRIIEFDGRPCSGTTLANLLEEKETWRLTILKYHRGDLPSPDRVVEGLWRRSFF
eukprot:Skav219009  [mRNA]  locus=scaffold169:636476:637195:+ [translate_table: standard]